MVLPRLELRKTDIVEMPASSKVSFLFLVTYAKQIAYLQQLFLPNLRHRFRDPFPFENPDHNILRFCVYPTIHGCSFSVGLESLDNRAAGNVSQAGKRDPERMVS